MFRYGVVWWFGLDEHVRAKPKINSIISNVKQRRGRVGELQLDKSLHTAGYGRRVCSQSEMEINHISLKCPLRRDTMGSLQPKGNFMPLSVDVMHHPVLFSPPLPLTVKIVTKK